MPAFLGVCRLAQMAVRPGFLWLNIRQIVCL